MTRRYNLEDCEEVMVDTTLFFDYPISVDGFMKLGMKVIERVEKEILPHGISIVEDILLEEITG